MFSFSGRYFSKFFNTLWQMLKAFGMLIMHNSTKTGKELPLGSSFASGFILFGIYVAAQATSFTQVMGGYILHDNGHSLWPHLGNTADLFRDRLDQLSFLFHRPTFDQLNSYDWHHTHLLKNVNLLGLLLGTFRVQYKCGRYVPATLTLANFFGKKDL
jgi:hypothetical protein